MDFLKNEFISTLLTAEISKMLQIDPRPCCQLRDAAVHPVEGIKIEP